MKRIGTFLAFLVLGIHLLIAQTVQISGTVTSKEDGQPLPGASVSVKGTTIGTISDMNGKFTLSIPSDAQILQIVFVGMVTQEIAIAGQKTVNVVMESATVGLDEVIVTALGISKQKKAIGYASTEVKSEETLQKSEPDLIKSLQAKVPGVDIRSSGGAPGSATRITIRGTNTFYGDNQPLFIVDGVPYSNVQYSTESQSTGGGAYGSSIATLDPNDIQSLTVLKGAAAAALYGSRAKNGVIMVTTKSGSLGIGKKKFEITYTSSYNIEKIANLPDYQNTYGAGSNFEYSNSNGSWGPRFDSLDSIDTWSGYKDALGWGTKIAYVAQPDNVKNLFQTGKAFENSINIQGGSDKSSFNMTASNLSNTGYIPNTEFNRNNISLGGTTKLANGLKVSATTSYSKGKQIGGVFGNNQSSEGYGASSMARALYLARNWIMDPYENPTNGYPLQPNGDQFDNPLWSWKHNVITTDMVRLTASIGLSYDIRKWITVNYKLGINNYIQNRKEVIDKGSRAVVFGKKGGITTDDLTTNEYNSLLSINFNKDFSENINITGLIGNEINERILDRKSFRGYNIINSGIYDISNTSKQVVNFTKYTKRRLMGIFGDVSIGYKRYLFLNFTARNDWSSTLPKTGNNYFYPGSNLSFIFSDALNLTNDYFSLGKLRVAWGKVGMDTDPYSIYESFDTKLPFLSQPIVTTSDIANNSKIKPEFKEDVEFGTQLSFLKSRINLDLTYYISTSTDMISPVYVSPSSGYTNLIDNVGKMRNKGVEIALNLIPVRSVSGFEWNIDMSFTKNKNEVLDINGKDSLTYISELFGDPKSAIIVGKPYGVLYGSVSARDSKGNLLIDPSTGLIIQAKNDAVIGDPNPDYTLGLSNTFRFKGFSLGILIDYRKGGDIFSNTISTLLGRGVTKFNEDREKTVIIPGVYGDVNSATPLLDAGGSTIPNTTQITVNDLYFSSGLSSFGINSYSEWQIFDATVFRVREITFGYDVPQKWLTKTPFGSVSISFSARNLWFYAPNIPQYTNFDPEINSYGSSNVQGVDYDAAPSTRRYGVNLKITF